MHLFDDERFAKLSGNAQSFFVALTLYAASELTDGRIPTVMVPRLLLAAHAKRRHLQELLDAGILEQLPITDGYYLPAFLKWNESKAEREAQREAGRLRQATHREKQKLQNRLRAV